jgi:hypothetical protein
MEILNSPSGYPSLQDDLWHVAGSDNSGQTDMKYVFDLFIDGEQKSRVKVFPEPGTGLGYFNAGPLVRNYVTYEWFTPSASVYAVEPSASGEVSQYYDIRYGEEITGTTDLNLVSGTTRAFNYVPPLFARRQTTIGSKLNKYLTNRPLQTNAKIHSLAAEIYQGNDIYVGFYTDASGLTMTVRTYDMSNSLVDTAVDDSYALVNGFVQLNISSAAINNRLADTLTEPEFITSNHKYYEVEFEGKVFRVYIVCPGRYDWIPLHFMNHWGVFDTAIFSLASKKIMDVERKGFTRRDHEFNGSSVDYYNTFSTNKNRYRESRINYGAKANHIMKLTMDPPTDAEYEWLNELISSPQIYMQDGLNYYPVTIKTSNYEYSTNLNNGMKPLEIEIELNQTRYSHQR